MHPHRRARAATASSTANASSSTAPVDYDNATRFHQLLDAYFKPLAARRKAVTKPKLTVATTTNSADAADESSSGATASNATPAPASAEEKQRDALKAIKLYLRHAQPANQTQFTRRVFDVVMHQLKRAKRSALVLTRVL
jgi:hypothetical protein